MSKGLKDWFAVFKAGTHTDSKGREHTFTTSDLDKIIENYDSTKSDFQEAPCVLGHPKSDDPAFGWIEDFKREGDTLYAKCKDVVAEFENAVKEGIYPNRSISLNPDFTVNHIGFLGAVKPAVKGLGKIAFSQNEDEITFNFSDGLIDEIKEGITLVNSQKNEFSQADIDLKNTEIDKLKAENEKLKTNERKTEYASFCEELADKGQMTPAQKEKILDFMELMYNAGEFEFSEGKKSAVDEFKDFLSCLPKQVEFSEIATGNGNPKDEENPEYLADKALAYQSEQAQKGINIPFEKAINSVVNQNQE